MLNLGQINSFFVIYVGDNNSPLGYTIDDHLFVAELHLRAKRAHGRGPIAKEMW